jgi:hypothetical protein
MKATSDNESKEEKQNPLQYTSKDIMTHSGSSISLLGVPQEEDRSAESHLIQNSYSMGLGRIDKSKHRVKCYPNQTSGSSIDTEELEPELKDICIFSSNGLKRIAPWEEAVGTLHEVNQVYGFLQARIGSMQICLPKEMLDELKGLLGQRIAILRTEKDYRLRILGNLDPYATPCHHPLQFPEAV